jgi:hypothetical protein
MLDSIRKRTPRVFSLAAFAALLLLASCGFDKLPDSAKNANKALLHSHAGTLAFTDSVYEFTSTNCVACHGNNQVPLFASSDMTQNYNLSKSYVNFADTSSSRFISRTKDGHCGGPCNTDGTAMLAAINEWREGEEEAGTLPPPPPPSQFVTTPQTIPATLPTGTTFITLTWGLGSYGPDYTGAQLSIEIQKFDMSSYRVRNPRLKTVGNALEIANIKPFLNNIYDPLNSNYVSIDSLVAPNVTAVLSTVNMIILMENGPGVDQISLSVGTLMIQ